MNQPLGAVTPHFRQIRKCSNRPWPMKTGSALSKVRAAESDREGDLGLFWQRVDGTGDAERLTQPAKGTSHFREAWSPDGSRLLYSVYEHTPIRGVRGCQDRDGAGVCFQQRGNSASRVPTGPPNARTLFEMTPDSKFLAMFDPDQLGPSKEPREIAVCRLQAEE